MSNLTPDSLALFLELARDAGNWSGQPLFQGTKAQQGNLTQLKQAGLVLTEDDDDACVWVEFTPAGIRLAYLHNVDLRAHYPVGVDKAEG